MGSTEHTDERGGIPRRSLLAMGGIGALLLSAELASPGKAWAAPTWYYPYTKRYAVTSPFGPRTPPTGGATSNHKGFDLGAPRGTAIYAVAPGTVTMAQSYGNYGYHVEIDHGAGFETTYSHMIAGSIAVSNGQRVVVGTLLGRTGATGNVSGPHLHFEFHVNGVAVDPAPSFQNAPLNPGSPTTPPNPLPVMEDETMYVIKNTTTGHVFVAGNHYVRHLSTSSDADLVSRVISNTDEIHELSATQTNTVFIALGIPRYYTDPNRLPHGGAGGWWSLQDQILTQTGGSLSV